MLKNIFTVESEFGPDLLVFFRGFLFSLYDQTVLIYSLSDFHNMMIQMNWNNTD